jgi:ribonuclease HI
MKEKIKIYTDASVKHNSKILTKIGFIVEQNNRTIFQKIECSLENNINEAEFLAVKKALRFVDKYSYEGFMLFTDSMYVVNEIEKDSQCQQTLERLKGKISWVKAHSKNKGNNKIDKLLKHV